MVTIARGARVYLDANIIIYLIEDFAEHRAAVAALLAAVVAADAELVTSELTLTEVLVKPLRDGQTAIVAEYENFLTGDCITLLPVSRDILRRAAELRASARMKAPDAIHVATAELGDCATFASHDAGIRLPAGVTHYRL